MKFPAVLLAVSLAANIALVGVFAFRPAFAPPLIQDIFSRDASTAGAPSSVPDRETKPAASEATKPAPLWSTLRTDDLPGLIAQLQAAGFPLRAIRAVVQGILATRYESRLRDLSRGDPSAPYWKATPTLGMDAQRMAEYSRLSSEYSKAVRDLLGAFNSRDDGDLTSAQRRRYGDISLGKIDAVSQIERDYSDMTSQLRAAMNGITLPEDKEKLALLDKEKQADLAEVLSPEELEGFNMRNSTITMRLRPTLTLFNPSEAEFRAIYRIEDSASDAIYPTTPVASQEAMQQRQTAQQQAADQIKAALGDQRYAEFVRSNDREYQQLAQLEQRENLAPGTAAQAYTLRDDLSQQSNQIFNDASLNTEQKRAALQALAQNTRTQILSTLGPTAGEAYLKTAASWLGNVERGGAVTFVPMLTGGTSTRTRSLPPVRPAAK